MVLTLIAVLLLIYVVLMWLTVRRVTQPSVVLPSDALIPVDAVLVDDASNDVTRYGVRHLELTGLFEQLARTPECVARIEDQLIELNDRLASIDARSTELLTKLATIQPRSSGMGWVLDLANLGAEIVDTQRLASLIQQVNRESAISIDKRLEEVGGRLQAIETLLAPSTKES